MVTAGGLGPLLKTQSGRVVEGSSPVGTVVAVEQVSSELKWQPRVRVSFENYLSAWIWPHVLVREDTPTT
jgi:hypothetical protein